MQDLDLPPGVSGILGIQFEADFAWGAFNDTETVTVQLASEGKGWDLLIVDGEAGRR